MREFQAAPETADVYRDAVVVLVHGLWVGGWSWMFLRPHLAAAGFELRAFSYASVNSTLKDNAGALARFVAAIDAPAVHFVGHSLGGGVICRALLDHPEPRPGRVVLLGSPFLDSLAGRRFGASAPGHALLGSTMQEWLASSPGRWDLPQPLGVIAGSLALGLGLLVAPELPRPHDGVVAVSETQVPGATDHIVLPVSHTGMLLAPRVALEATAFLRSGRFRHQDRGAAAP